MVKWNDFAAKWLDTLLTTFAARPSLQARSRGWGWGKTGDSHFPPSPTPANKDLIHRLRWKKCYSNKTFLAELFGCPVNKYIFNFIPCTVHVFIQLFKLQYKYMHYLFFRICQKRLFWEQILWPLILGEKLKLSSFLEYDCSKSQSPLVFGIKTN